jgi:hypothetical protein
MNKHSFQKKRREREREREPIGSLEMVLIGEIIVII